MLPTITAIGHIKKLDTGMTQSGKRYTRFSISCSEKRDKDNWNNLLLSGCVWEKSSDFVNKYFRVGSAAQVTGKLHTNMYEKNGNKIYNIEFMFPQLSFVPSDKEDSNQMQQPFQPSQNNYQQSKNGGYGQPTAQDVANFDDDILF